MPRRTATTAVRDGAAKRAPKPKPSRKAKPTRKAKPAKPKRRVAASAKPRRATSATRRQPAAQRGTSTATGWDALAAEIDQIPEIAGVHLEPVMKLLERLPRSAPKRATVAATSATDAGFHHDGLRTALVALVQRSRATWKQALDFGVVNTVVGRLEAFPKFRRADIPWHR